MGAPHVLLVFACDKFQSYITNSKMFVHMDHRSLRYLLAKKDAKPRLIQWILLLQQFDLQIVDCKREDNPIADHLLCRERIPYDPVPINVSFPGDSLAMIKKDRTMVCI